AGGSGSVSSVLAPYNHDLLQVEHLSVNYRTPSRIMERAVSMAQAHDLPETPVISVREGDRGPLIERTGPGELVARTAQAVATLHAERLGRIAVIADEERLPSLVATLRSQQGLPAVGAGSAGVDDEIAVMTAQ